MIKNLLKLELDLFLINLQLFYCRCRMCSFNPINICRYYYNYFFKKDYVSPSLLRAQEILDEIETMYS